jgi:hypothetical protein
MKSSEVRELIIRSLDSDTDSADVSRKLELEGVSYDFDIGFTDAVLARIFKAGSIVKHEIDFVRSMNFAFKSIAISGLAAIIVLMISIFLMEGSISIDSFLGLRDNYDESIICLLTGK